MNWWIWTAFVIIICFGFVLLRGAPYLPTLKKQIDTALDMLDLNPGQTMLELGCGDGRVLRAAAKRGIKVVGYELNPILVIISRIVTWKYRKNVKVIWGDIWLKEWPPAEGIFTFLLQKYTSQLNTKIIKTMPKPVKLVSFAFTITNKKPTREKDGLFLYVYK
jgi:16S rRNA A1518/A1519 N6-dimethyltransferase RsmA/KsgA/DIM1 with predicted DNA glycosylase/AP lyase activity